MRFASVRGVDRCVAGCGLTRGAPLVRGCTPRGWGPTGGHSGLLHEGPDLVQYAQPLASTSPPSCSSRPEGAPAGHDPLIEHHREPSEHHQGSEVGQVSPGRGHSARTGAGLLSPNAQTAPDGVECPRPRKKACCDDADSTKERVPGDSPGGRRPRRGVVRVGQLSVGSGGGAPNDAQGIRAGASRVRSGGVGPRRPARLAGGRCWGPGTWGRR